MENFEYSIAGFFPAEENSEREVFNFNPGWRFIKRDAIDAHKVDFNDAEWENVTLPHGLELLPENANSSFQYRGISWYRKHFDIPEQMNNRKVFIYFEGVMNKCVVWVNGEKCGEHKGGYLPFIWEISDLINWDKKNIIAVKTDNRDDLTFPPGRPERMMDYSYFGGMYRDVWLFSTNNLHVSDPIRANKVADGGVFIHADEISEKNATLFVNTNVINEGNVSREFILETIVYSPNGECVGSLTETASVEAGENRTITQNFVIKSPNLWSPENPKLYNVKTLIKCPNRVVDALTTKTGIRKIEIREGKLFLNNKQRFLFGANRHQDRAYVGIALPNSEHYRDACRLREAAFECYRSHYPQDPAFMDACDHFGLLAINSVPGWWFFTPDNGFPEACVQAIREMIRINRNRPSCFIWEIGLNETFYHSDFIVKAHEAASEEYPYEIALTAEDPPLKYHGGYYRDGKFIEHNNYPRELVNKFPTTLTYHDDQQSDKPYFCRESSGFYDNFVGENAVHSVCRDWGENPMFVQIKWYIKWLNELYRMKRGLGACIWLAFDYYRGNSPEIAYKGQMDCYRLPKNSYYFFKSQGDPNLKIDGVKTGPMVHIAHSLTPFSPEDIIVFSNCEKVRLTLPDGEVIEKKPEKGSIKHSPVIFKGLFNWQKETQKWASPTLKDPNSGRLVAEGVIDDKVVAKDIRQAASRVAGLELEVDYLGHPLVANGGDFVAARAYFVDKHGNRRVLARNNVYFKIEGEGEIIGDHKIQANPFKSQFGTAVVFVKSTTIPGTITLTAFTTNMGHSQIKIETISPQNNILIGDTLHHEKKAIFETNDFKSVSGTGMSEEDFEIQGIVTPVIHPDHK